MNKESNCISDKLLAYLRIRLKNPTIEYKSPPEQLHGGFETQIYRFQLIGVSQAFSAPLVLRLYPEYYGSGNAVWESTVQNVLTRQGFPVAKAYLLCTDMTVLGGAFFIMDCLPGYPMLNALVESVPEILGKTHAAMHNFEVKPLIKSLVKAGIEEDRLYLDKHFHWLKEKVSEFPWLRDAGDWLIEHQPSEPEKLAVCHGDFHPLNILVQDGRITGVLDWPGFMIADPALDIAITLVLITIPYKHIAPSLRSDLSSVDFDIVAERYLEAYQKDKDYDAEHLDYYRVRRCIQALIHGAQGQTSWQHPGVVKDLIDFILVVTGVEITTLRY